MKNYYVNLYKLNSGDEIIVPKSAFNLIQHHAMYLGYDENGTHWIIHNTIGTGVNLITVDDFFGMCRQVNKIIKFKGTESKREGIIQKALMSVGKPYDFINYNCEHFVNDLKSGKAQSKQVENAFWGLLIGLLVVGIMGD